MHRLVIALGVLCGACTHSVHQVGLVGLAPPPAGARVHAVAADAEQWVLLYITDNTDYVDQAYRELAARCPDGEVRAIQARSSTSHGFLSHTNRLVLRGQCVRH